MTRRYAQLEWLRSRPIGFHVHWHLLASHHRLGHNVWRTLLLLTSRHSTKYVSFRYIPCLTYPGRPRRSTANDRPAFLATTRQAFAGSHDALTVNGNPILRTPSRTTPIVKRGPGVTSRCAAGPGTAPPFRMRGPVEVSAPATPQIRSGASGPSASALSMLILNAHVVLVVGRHELGAS